MPPRAKYTREGIAEAALALVRKEGASALTARSLASALGTSTAPIFTAYASIDEVMDAVIARAFALYRNYLEEGLRHPIPFKGTGLAYIRFAKEEPMLFRLLFVEPKNPDPLPHYFPGEGEHEEKVRATVEGGYGLNGEAARYLYNHISVYVQGLASLYAYGRCVFTDEDVDRMLSEVFFALRESLSKKEEETK